MREVRLAQDREQLSATDSGFEDRASGHLPISFFIQEHGLDAVA
jgi:hypothetical protein